MQLLLLAGYYIALLQIKKWKMCCFVSVKSCKNTYMRAAAAAAKLLQSCLTLCAPIEGSPLGSPVPGILQARVLEWVAISFSNAWNWKVEVKSLSRVRLLATPWTAAHQAPPSMGFSRQEYWSGCRCLLWYHRNLDSSQKYTVQRGFCNFSVILILFLKRNISISELKNKIWLFLSENKSYFRD